MPFLFFRRNMSSSEILNTIKKENSRAAKRIGILAVIAFFSAFVCLCSGSSGLGVREFINVLSGNGTDAEKMILVGIRLPRVAAAVIAGAGLSVSGCIMQKVLSNPLASPSTLGVSNGAVFGANIAIILLGAGSVNGTVKASLTVNNPYTITACSFAAALSGVAIILLLSAKKRFSSETVVLCGVAVGSFFTAGTTLLQYFSADSQVSSAVFWSFGDLGRASVRECVYMAAATVTGIILAAVKARDIDLFEQGDETARSLGINVFGLRLACLCAASLICAVCVSFLGIIGFVGLCAPHAAKRITGSKMSVLLPSAALCGMIILPLSDAAARSVIHGVSLPVGAVTSLFGGPIFLFLLLGKGGVRRAVD